MMQIGQYQITALPDGSGREVAGEVLHRHGVADPWAQHADLLDSAGELTLAVGGYLVRSTDRVMLIDAGVGTIDNGRYQGGRFLESLSEQGVSTDDVTDVVFTHLHFDHVGWATQKGKVVFGNAVYRVHQADWEHFVDGPNADPGAVRKLSPLRSQLELFAGEVELAPGFRAREMPGHTPGSTIFIVDGDSREAVFIGDLAHVPIELVEPGWHFVHDFDPVAAGLARETFVADYSNTGTPVFTAHFPGLRPGLLSTDSGTARWTYL